MTSITTSEILTATGYFLQYHVTLKEIAHYLFTVEPHPFCRYKRWSKRDLMN